MLNKCLIALILLIVSSCGMTSRKARKTFEKNIVFTPYDAIIVPGVPFNGENWSETMKRRVFWSTVVQRMHSVFIHVYTETWIFRW